MGEEGMGEKGMGEEGRGYIHPLDIPLSHKLFI
jgi:hypothetical protein